MSLVRCDESLPDELDEPHPASTNVAAAIVASSTIVYDRGRVRPRVIIPVRLVMSTTDGHITETFPQRSKLVPGGVCVPRRFTAEAKSSALSDRPLTASTVMLASDLRQMSGMFTRDAAGSDSLRRAG